MVVVAGRPAVVVKVKIFSFFLRRIGVVVVYKRLERSKGAVSQLW